MNQYLIKSKLGNINIIEGVKVEKPQLKAIILHVHGIGSHFQSVYENIDDFSERDKYFSKYNYKSVCFEFYGHGKSDGIRCCISDFNDLVDDLETVILHLTLNDNFSNIPIYLLAESMGAAVCLKFIIRNIKTENIKAIILISPMCGIDDHLKPSPIMISFLMCISNIFPTWKLVTTTKKMGTENVNNKDYIDARDKCPYGFKGSHRLATAREMYLNSLWTPNNAHLINKPILIFQGEHDKITTPFGTQTVYEKIPQTINKELVLLPNSEHCLLVQDNADDLTPNYIISKIICWLEDQITK
jgi:acylglycerol lipase